MSVLLLSFIGNKTASAGACALKKNKAQRRCVWGRCGNRRCGEIKKNMGGGGPGTAPTTGILTFVIDRREIICSERLYTDCAVSRRRSPDNERQLQYSQFITDPSSPLILPTTKFRQLLRGDRKSTRLNSSHT